MIDYQKYIDMAIPVAKSIAMALLELILGLMIIKWIIGKLRKYVDRSSMDPTLKPFILSLTDISLKVLLAISIISLLGIDTNSLVAVIAAAGFAVGLALKEYLANFAGGVILLTLRPFKVGDVIEANGYSGTVEAIQILYTRVATFDNKVVLIPNGVLSNSSITNFTLKDTRRVDLSFGAAYEADTDKVVKVLKDMVNNHPLVLVEPEPFVRMSEHADSAIIYSVKAWVKTDDYWSVYFDLIEAAKRRFDEENIAIPYPQRDVYVYQK